jgi:hypothetical protein
VTIASLSPAQKTLPGTGADDHCSRQHTRDLYLIFMIFTLVGQWLIGSLQVQLTQLRADLQQRFAANDSAIYQRETVMCAGAQSAL